MTPAPRVLLASSYSAHYRLGVWRELASSSLVHLDIATARTASGGHESDVEPITAAELPQMTVHATYRLGTFRWQPGLLRQACSRRYDIVIWDPAYRSLAVWMSSVWLRARGVTLVYWGLGWTRRHGRVKEWAKVRVFRLAHGFLTYGRQSAQRAAEAGYPRNRLYVVGNSMIDSPPARGVAQAGLPEPTPLVLGTSLRLTARKRVDLLIRAVAALQSSSMPCRVVIVGDGPELAALQSLADQLGVDARFLGARYEPEQIADFYSQVHLTVLPGHAGLTVVQSLMHGRPVVTHDNPEGHAAEWEALREGRSGSLFGEGDLAGLVSTIREVSRWIERDAAGVAERCRADYLAYGDPAAHAERILHSILSIHQRKTLKQA